ncbi:MAG: metal-dependent hydrolase, partial [Bermanella sp.]
PYRALRMNRAALVLSSVYIVWSLGAKFYIDQTVKTALHDRQIQAEYYLSTPAPFSTLLWRILVMSGDEYYEGYVSIFDSPSEVSLDNYDSTESLLTEIEDEWDVQRLQWFTKGFYAVKQEEKNIILSDLRMGVECYYVFNFIVGEESEAGIVKRVVEKVSVRPDLSMLGSVWDRVWDSSVSLAPMLENGLCVKQEG